MPGRGRGRGRGGQRRRVMSFLQPCLLLLLRRGHSHGYSLLNDLAEFGFRPGQKDPSLVYRALRDMEEQGLVGSEWDPDSLGPQRRVYRITLDGERHLHDWIDDLRHTQQEINHLVLAYERLETRKGGDEP
jgi:PadR family transcriptional regulator, regulatory protein PadR